MIVSTFGNEVIYELRITHVRGIFVLRFCKSMSAEFFLHNILGSPRRSSLFAV